MAKLFLSILAHALLILSLIVSSPPAAAAGDDHESSFARTVDRKLMGLKKEKLSHFRFYWHDVTVGQNKSSMTVVQGVNTSATFFGTVNMIDNALTAGPDLSSKLLGRAQGFYALASQEDVSLLMAMNFAFTQGKYNGSSITILGRNPVFNSEREMPVIGGSGVLRFARGYAKLKTHTFNLTDGSAVVRYDVYVLHY